MSQEARNKIYALGVAAFGLAVILGVVDQTNADVALGLFNSTLDVIVIVIGLVTNIIAFVKSLTSKVTTVEVPKANVESVNLISGRTSSIGGKLQTNGNDRL